MCHFGYAQKFQSRAAIGSFTYGVGIMTVKPGPGWKGYFLPRRNEVGVLLTTSNGFVFDSLIYLGIGVSYARYASFNGILASVDFVVDFEKQKRKGEFLYMSPGFSHFWNLYPGGTSTGLFELGLGYRWLLSHGHHLRFSIGLMGMQQSTFIAGRIAYTL